MSKRQHIIVWADVEQGNLVRAAVRYADLHLAGIGSPSSSASAQLSDALKADRIEDLRQAIQTEDLDLLWLAAPHGVAVAERRLIREMGLRAISTEPRPVDISAAISDPSEADTADFVPLMRRSAGYRAASQVLEDFGPAQCVNVFLRSGEGEGTLIARLFDAMDVIDALCGEPETLDAALSSPLPGVPDSLAGLHGHLTVNLRFAGNRCACVAVSDLAGRWFRGVTVLGENGCLRINDAGFDWIARDGQIVETLHDKQPLSAGELVGEQIRRTLDSLDTTDPPPHNARLLALCESARLSCRTGQGETPRKVMEMMSRT
ncbi:MAG: hypothetical protein JSV91_12455 [Phycisphaerales bacterium]|nr:MAG: hypothetical protein JSV91_12455 [Phycisphaerales bacterium]